MTSQSLSEVKVDLLWAVPDSNLAIYDVIIAVKAQDLDLRNRTTPCRGESRYETSYKCFSADQVIFSQSYHGFVFAESH